MLEENERQMRDVDLTWEQRLSEAKLEWEKSVVAEPDATWTHVPHIVNINEDPQLSGVIKHELDIGQYRHPHHMN